MHEVGNVSAPAAKT